MEDAADSNRRGKINCNVGHFCVADSGEIFFSKFRRKTKYFGKNRIEIWYLIKLDRSDCSSG